MKFTISKREFAKHIGQVLKGIPSRTKEPILKNFYIEADKERQIVSVTATDMTIQIQSETPSLVEHNGSICVDAKLLDGLLKKVKLKAKEEKELLFYVDGGDLIVEIDSSKTTLKIVESADFPFTPWEQGDIQFSIEGDDLSETIKQVSFSTLKNESRPILSGVLAQAEGDYLTMVSTDGHRMSLKINKVEGLQGDLNRIIPVDSLSAINKIVTSNKKSIMNVSVSENYGTFEVNGVRILTSFIPGDFLNYKRIFGMKHQTKVIVDKEAILEVLERASIFIPKDNIALAVLKAEDDLLHISIASESGNVEETLDSNMTGDSIEIAFNITYLMSALKALKEDRIAFHMTNSTHPVIIEAVGNKSYKHMLLPIKQSN